MLIQKGKKVITDEQLDVIIKGMYSSVEQLRSQFKEGDVMPGEILFDFIDNFLPILEATGKELLKTQKELEECQKK